MLIKCLTWSILHQYNIGTFIELGFYLNIAICALLVYKLALGEAIFNLKKKTDAALGNYSYPIYLLHWQSGIIASYMIFGEAFHELALRGLLSFFAALIIITALSSLFILLLDNPIQSIRKKIKEGA